MSPCGRRNAAFGRETSVVALVLRRLRRRRGGWLVAVALGGSSALVLSSAASGADLFLTPKPTNIWTISIGDQGFWSPRFPGSGKYGFGAFPSLSIRRFG